MDLDKNLPLASTSRPKTELAVVSVMICRTIRCATLCQGTVGISGAHTMVGMHRSVLLQVLGLVPGVCLSEVVDRALAHTD